MERISDQESEDFEILDKSEAPDFDENDENAIDADFKPLTNNFTPPARAAHVAQLHEDEVQKDDFALFLEGLPKNEDVTIIVTRLADKNLSGEFRITCNAHQKVDTIYWNGETEPDELYSQFTKKHGGGRYSFQIRRGKGFDRAWTQILGDPAEPSEKEKTILAAKAKMTEHDRTPEHSQLFAQPQTAVKPIDELIEQFEKMNRLREAITPPAQPQPQTISAEPTAARRSIKDEMLLSLTEQAKESPELRQLIIGALFDRQNESTEKTGFDWSTAMNWIFENPEQSFGVLSGLAGSLFSAFRPPTPPQTVNYPPVNFPPVTPPVIPTYQPPQQTPSATPPTGLQSFKVPREQADSGEPIETLSEQPQPLQTPTFIRLED